MGELRIRVLGPIEADIDGVALRLSKSRHREILGILVAAQGRTTSVSALVDDLWDDAPPGAVGAIRTFIGELRRLLEPERPPRTAPQILVSKGDGYALRPERASVDVWRAERRYRDASEATTSRQTTTEATEPLLSGALAEWRGTAYEEFGTRAWAQPERARIAALRARIVEQLADARLQLGHSADVVTLLGPHVTEHPWREDSWRLLALALYRSGRQVDALAVLRQASNRLVQDLGLDPGERLADLERGILLRDPALDLPDPGGSILLRTASAQATSGVRAQLESATTLIPLLAVSGGLEVAAQQRIASIAAAEQFGDLELTARVIGGFDVPGSWTRSDDPARSTVVVDAALRTLSSLAPGTSDRVRARLLATIAMESRGTADRLAEATEAERLARTIGDAPLLCFALSARYMQCFATTGLARSREAIAVEILSVSREAELPTFEILARIIRMQALCALDDIAGAAVEADAIDALAARFERPLASVFTAWFRWTFRGSSIAPPSGAEMPGFARGITGLSRLTLAVRQGTRLPEQGRGGEQDLGPYEPWARPLLLVRAGRVREAVVALDSVPDPPRDLLAEVAWCLVGRAALESGHTAARRRAYEALLPAAAERAAGSGVVDLGPVSTLVAELAAAETADATVPSGD